MTNVPKLPCMCASLRRASRALSQIYDEALRPLGFRGTQFTILQALSLTGEVSQGRLGEVLAMDSTTLTRTLDIVRRRGWIKRTRGADRREWRLSLTKSGEAQLKRGTVAWEKTQEEVGRQLGQQRWHELQKLADEITALAQNQGDRS